MKSMQEPAGPAFTREAVMQACEAIRQEQRPKWWTAAHWQCWGCTTFTKGDLEKRCFASAPGNRGCELVNRRLEGLH